MLAYSDIDHYRTRVRHFVIKKNVSKVHKVVIKIAGLDAIKNGEFSRTTEITPEGMV